MLLNYLKRDLNLKFLLIMQMIIIATMLFMQFVFSNYAQDYKSANSIKLGVINDDSTDMKSMLLIENFKNNDNFSELFHIIEAPPDQIREMFVNRDIDAYVEIPKGFAQGLMHYENQTIKLFVDVGNPTKNAILSNVFKAYSNFIQGSNLATYSLYNTMEKAGLDSETLRSINRAFSVEMVGTALTRDELFDVSKHNQLPLVDALRYFLYALPFSFIAFLCIEHGVNYKRARAMLITRREILIGNSIFKVIFYDVISKGVLGLLLFIPIFIAQCIFYSWEGMFTSMLLIFIAMLIFTLLWRIVSFFVRSEFGISVFGSFVAFVISLAGGCVVPYVILPNSLKQIGELTPLFALLKLSMPLDAIGVENFAVGIVGFVSLIVVGFVLEYMFLKHEYS